MQELEGSWISLDRLNWRKCEPVHSLQLSMALNAVPAAATPMRQLYPDQFGSETIAFLIPSQGCAFPSACLADC